MASKVFFVMASRNIEKVKETKEAIDQKITSILVINNSRLKPFIELFEHSPENVLMKPLGTLFGFFKINDNSEDSSYIVNFLTSILKKEYFANHKRSVVESFDAALKKVNLALSELAKQGNINWIGQLNGAVCIVEGSNFHFTVCGKSSILLLRNGMMSEISKDLATDSDEPNPLKTFVDVSSGQLFPKDKIIITSEDLFNLFSLPQIKKNALRFSNEQFGQFVKTALVNELKVAGTIILDISEPAPKPISNPIKAKKRREENINVFSEKTFRQANTINIQGLPVINTSGNAKNEYVDKKTGHIYIQGEDQLVEKENELWQKVKEFLSNFLFQFKEKGKTSISRKFKKLKNWIIEKKEIENIEVSKKAEVSIPAEISAKTEGLTIEDVQKLQEKEAAKRQTSEKFKKLLQSAADAFLKVLPAAKAIFLKIIPSCGKIKNIFSGLSRNQKIASLIIVLAIIIIPLIYVKSEKKNEESVEQPVQKIEEAKENTLAENKSFKELDLQDLSAGEKASAIVSLRGENFIIADNKIISLENQKQYLIEEISNIKFVCAMEDLNLIFLMDNIGKTVSFSPISSAFKPNNLTLPENSKIEATAIYSTYLYLIDSANNQIYRYPRAEGGFGAKTNWLKDNIDLKDVKAMAVDENLYLLKNNQILKFYRGKQENIQFESLKNEAQFSSIFTNEETQNIYVLDEKFGRIIKYSKTGELIGQYQNDQLKGLNNFSVDEQNNKLYFISSENKIFSGELN